VAYNSNGGGGFMEDSRLTLGVPQSLRINTFTKPGYALDGWATSAAGPAVYTDGQSVINLATVAEVTVTLYAVWGPAYTVIYDANGGAGVMEKSEIIIGKSQNLRLNSFTRTGYVLDGWATSADGTAVYDNRQSVRNLATTAGAVVKLYAVWQPVTEVPGTGLAAKLDWLQSNAVSGEYYSIEVNADENISPATLSYGKYVRIILKGTGTERIVSLSSDGALFTVGNGVTLTLDGNITLQGRDTNFNSSLVWINSGGTFTMNGGEISGNTAARGGGVYVADDGTFQIITGTIYGSDADEGLKNTSDNGGAALYKEDGGTAECGTFDADDEWSSNGDLDTTDGTIEVEEGVLQQ
jgi:uncharacterized repeat protein (TIGR02543 family)